MATRPAWCIKDNRIIEEEFEFEWVKGLNITQQKKCALSLGNAIREKTGLETLEVSTKSSEDLGAALSAFSLRLNGYYLENVFQASKKFKGIGTNDLLLSKTPREAKQYSKDIGKVPIEAFVYDGTEWPTMPTTAFYDYIYVLAVTEKYGHDLDLSRYSYFTDIAFNPEKSVNCQARALALYKLIRATDRFDVLNSRDEWIAFHKSVV